MIEIHELVIKAVVTDGDPPPAGPGPLPQLDAAQLDRLADQVTARVIEKLRQRTGGLASWD